MKELLGKGQCSFVIKALHDVIVNKEMFQYCFSSLACCHFLLFLFCVLEFSLFFWIVHVPQESRLSESWLKRTTSCNRFSRRRCNLGRVYFYPISTIQGRQSFLPVVSFLEDLRWQLDFCTVGRATVWWERGALDGVVKLEDGAQEEGQPWSTSTGCELHCSEPRLLQR